METCDVCNCAIVPEELQGYKVLFAVEGDLSLDRRLTLDEFVLPAGDMAARETDGRVFLFAASARPALQVAFVVADNPDQVVMLGTVAKNGRTFAEFVDGIAEQTHAGCGCPNWVGLPHTTLGRALASSWLGTQFVRLEEVAWDAEGRIWLQNAPQIVPGADPDIDWLVAHEGEVFMQHCIGPEVPVDLELTPIIDRADYRYMAGETTDTFVTFVKVANV